MQCAGGFSRILITTRIFTDALTPVASGGACSSPAKLKLEVNVQPFTKLTSTFIGAMLGAAAFVAVALTAAPATAQDYPYCLQGRQWGYPGKCDFTSYEQCQATASGTDSYCGINPRFAFGSQPQRRRAYNGW
jgi:hypothetical protein